MKINRRNSIKALIALAIIFISSLSIFKWIRMISLPKLSLLHDKKALIAEIAELIIPKTDTPGAKDAKVEDFIIGMIEFCSDTKTQNNFVRGLEKFANYAVNNYDKSFTSCDQSEKAAIMTYFENNARYKYNILNKISNKILGKPFIIKFKELTIEGYCTSELGATTGLAYDYLPVNYEPCIPLTANQLSWSTK